MGFSFIFSQPKFIDASDKLECKYSLNRFSNIIIESAMQLSVIGNKSDSSIKLFLIKAGEATHVAVNEKVLENNTLEVFISTDKEIKGYVEISVQELNLLKIESQEADVNISQIISNSIQIGTKQGDINISDSNFEEAICKSSDGDITIILTDHYYNLSLHTESGDITKKIKSNSSASRKINCQTSNGDIYIEKSK